MWKYLLLGLLLVDAPLASARAETPELGPPSDMTVSAMRGEAAVRARCSSCHAVALDDASPNPKSPPLRTIGERYPVENLAEAFAEGIMVSHKQEMPAFELSAEETADIIAYLKELRRENQARELAQ